jgi:hypothetical protein
MVHELGFKIYDVCLDTSAFYYQFKIEHIIFYLNEFIQEYGKFPSMAEIKTILHIDSNIILKLGGLFNIKQSMGIKFSAPYFSQALCKCLL